MVQCVGCGRFGRQDGTEIDWHDREMLGQRDWRTSQEVICCGSGRRFNRTSEQGHQDDFRKDEECPHGFIEYRAGLSPREHYEVHTLAVQERDRNFREDMLNRREDRRDRRQNLALIIAGFAIFLSPFVTWTLNRSMPSPPPVVIIQPSSIGQTQGTPQTGTEQSTPTSTNHPSKMSK